MTELMILRPNVTKSIVKGGIAIAIFSLFLQINPSRLFNFAIFIIFSLLLVFLYALLKKANKYVLTEKNIVLHSLLRAEKTIDYTEITSLSISSGFLARRLDCGTIFVNTRNRSSAYIALNGGMAEALRDVKHPFKVYEIIESRLQFF